MSEAWGHSRKGRTFRNRPGSDILAADAAFAGAEDYAGRGDTGDIVRIAAGAGDNVASDAVAAFPGRFSRMWLSQRNPCGGSLHPPAHGSTGSAPISSKSRTLRVATAMPRARAIAAIWPSAWETGRPARRRAATISA